MNRYNLLNLGMADGVRTHDTKDIQDGIVQGGTLLRVGGGRPFILRNPKRARWPVVRVKPSSEPVVRRRIHLLSGRPNPTQIHLTVEYDFILRQGDRIDLIAEVFSDGSQ